MRLLQQKTGRGGFEELVIHFSIIRPTTNDVIQNVGINSKKTRNIF